MLLLPIRTETIVSAQSQEDLISRLDNVLYSFSDRNKGILEDKEHVFIGSHSAYEFSISLKAKRADNFIPIINGSIETTSKGSIVFLRYALFYSTRLFLIFWTIVLITMATILIFLKGALWFGVLALIIAIVNYGVTFVNFRRRVKESHDHLLKVFG